MSTTERGKRAEKAAGTYLEEHGFSVLEYNWRTRYCEIDIVARRDNVLHFVEVKYRASSRQGTGLEYITAQKLKQMHFAAELWAAAHKWQGEMTLSAIEVTGSEYTVGDFIENADG